MLFSKVKFFKFNKPFPVDENSLRTALEDSLFKGVAKSQMNASGFVNPFNKQAENPVHGIEGAFAVTIRHDFKTIPVSLINKKLKSRVKEFETRKSDKATKEEKAELKEEITAELVLQFPVDFIKTKFITALIYPKEELFAVDSVSSNDCDLIIGLLRGAIGTFPVVEFESTSIPSLVMSSWLTDTSKVPETIEVLRACTLRENIEESPATAVVKNQDLYSAEVEAHLDADKVVSMIAVEWNDSIKFNLKEDLTASGISYTDVLNERLKEEQSDTKGLDRFDAELALTVGNLRMLAPDLLNIFS